MTLDEVIEWQADHEMKDVHVVFLHDDHFVMAHTDDERASMDLHDCPIHKWLSVEGQFLTHRGLFSIKAEEPDGYSQSYRSNPWTLEPLT
jgi:hypothetical protein